MAFDIKFYSFEQCPTGGFACMVAASDHTQPDRLVFEMDGFGMALSQDAIAVMLSTLCGTRYEKIVMALSVSKRTADVIRSFTKGEVTFENESAAAAGVSGKGGYLLNFSGGFDSLAAKCIMPPETKLVAIQFGKVFEREHEFFKQFKPHILRTNFRDLKYDRAHWMFMGAAMALFAETLGCEYGVFGTILEATDWNFVSTPTSPSRQNISPFSGIGIKVPPLTQGLSEVGTVMVIARFCPDLVAPALASLAAPGSEKLYRKYLLAKAVSADYHYDLALPECLPTDAKSAIPWGKSLACDLLSLYMMRHFGYATASKMVKGIPSEAVALAGELNLKFLEHYNTNFLAAVPKDLSDYALGRMEEAGVLPYDENDWRSFARVKEFLSPSYPRLAL